MGIFDWEIPEPKEEYHDEHLYEISYGSTYTISNLGTLYLIFLLFCFEAIMLFLLKPVAVIKPNPLLKWHTSFSKALYWNSFLRLILEASLDLAIASFNNVNIVNREYNDGIMEWYKPDLPFFWVNGITTIGAVIVLIIGPWFLLIYYLCKFKKWNDEGFETSMGSVLEGLRKDRRSAIFYPVFFIFRRTTFAVQAIFFVQYFAFQSQL